MMLFFMKRGPDNGTTMLNGKYRPTLMESMKRRGSSQGKMINKFQQMFQARQQQKQMKNGPNVLEEGLHG